MNEDFASAINNELERLEQALSENVLFVRWRELQRVRRLYLNTSHAPVVGDWHRQITTDTERTTSASTRRVSAERQEALLYARNLLRGRTIPTPTRDILAFLRDNGVHIPGKDPVSNLSAMLSNSDEFDSHGRSGWTFKADGEEPADEESIQVMMDDAWRDLI